MISWVVDHLRARSADGRVSHDIVVYREAESLADFRRGKWQIRAITESLLACEQRGPTQWYIPSLDMVLLADRELKDKSSDAATDLDRSPTPE